MEPFAPELDKEYVLTEELVQTAFEITLPSLLQPSQEVPFAMTYREFQRMKNAYGDQILLPKLGIFPMRSRLKVTQMFTYRDLNGSTRYSKLLIFRPASEDLFTAYARWNYIRSKLEEVE